jgi:hypothetical protein
MEEEEVVEVDLEEEADLLATELHKRMVEEAEVIWSPAQLPWKLQALEELPGTMEILTMLDLLVSAE